MFVIASLALVVAEVSSWDKSAAIAGIVAAITGIILLTAAVAGFALGRWMSWRRTHTFNIETTGFAVAGDRHVEIVTAVVRREFLSHQPTCYLSVTPQENYRPHQDVLSYDIERLDDSQEFPTVLGRGTVMRFKLTVNARKPWRGFLCVAAADESHELRLTYKKFEVVKSA